MAPNAKTLTLELIDQRPSGFVLEGTTGAADDERISAPNKYFLLTQSVVKEPTKDGGYRYRNIRHISGCETIYVDEQKAQGVTPNPELDQIVFENGLLLVANEGRDRSKFAYLMACEFNFNNPHRPEHAEPKFRVIEKEKKAEQFLHNISDKLQAMSILTSLSERMENGFSYNNEKIDFMCSLHGVHGYETPGEKLQALVFVAEADPKKFIDSVANARSSYKVDIAEAERFNVISMAGDHASFMDGGLKFFKFTQKTAAKRSEELVDFFLTRGGEQYAQLKTALDAAKTREAALA